jgi:hypothetical protein
VFLLSSSIRPALEGFSALSRPALEGFFQCE